MNDEDEKEIQKAIQNIAFEFIKINKIIFNNAKKQDILTLPKGSKIIPHTKSKIL